MTVMHEPHPKAAESTPVSRRILAGLAREPWLIRLGALLLLALYARSIGFLPVYDDNAINPWTSLTDIPKFFTHDIFGFDGNAHSVYYRPMTMVWSLLIRVCTSGVPAWFHLQAVLLHISVVMLAYTFGRRLFGDLRLGMLTAILFGLHPSKVESVAWVGSSCVEGLGGVFFFASLILYLKWRESRAAVWLGGSVALYAAAVFTKETMLIVPMLIGAHLWLFSVRKGRVWLIVRALAPYGAVSALYLVVRHRVILPATGSVEYVHPTFSLANLWTAPYAILWYLSHLMMPWGLSVEYAANVVEVPTLRSFVLPGIVILALAAAAAWAWSRRRSKTALFLFCWFALAIAPPVILAPMVSEHDRYLYIPGYAFCALVAWGILYAGKLGTRARFAVGLAVVALWSALTWHEMGYWSCEKALWSRSLEVSPSQPKAQLQLAFVYSESGDSAKALSILEEGLRYRPNAPKIWLARAGILEGNQRLQEARAEYLKVLQLTEPAALKPGEPLPPPYIRAHAAYRLGLMELSAGKLLDAEGHLRMAISAEYKGVGYHASLSRCLAAEGRAGEAMAENATELRLRLEQRPRS